MLPLVFRGLEDAGFFVHALTVGGNTDLIDVLQGNQPRHDGGYVCVIPVLDYWRLHPGHCSAANVPHFSLAVEPSILEHARQGRALLLFDLSNEGPAFDSTLFDIVHGYLEKHAIPATQAVWLSQNRAIEAKYRAHYRAARDSFIGFECYDFFLKVMATRFADPEYAAGIGSGIEALCADQYDVGVKDRTFLCLNATPRPHRVLAIAALLFNDLMGDALVSFPGLAYEKDGTSLRNILAHMEAHPGLSYLRESCEAVTRLPALRVDRFTERGNSLFDLIDPEPYRRTFFSMVTETDLSDGRVARITEKTLKAYSLGHPCYILGNPGATRFVAELGFETFGDVLDLSHDEVADPADRFNVLLRSVKKEVARIKQAPSTWLARVSGMGAANIRHAFSGKLLQRYITQYDRPTVASLERRLAGGFRNL